MNRANRDRKSRRSRTANWTVLEKQNLLELIKVRRHIIVQEKGSNGSNLIREKSVAWGEILQELKIKFGQRFSNMSVKNIKTQWQNMKRIARLAGVNLEGEDDIPLSQLAVIKKELDDSRSINNDTMEITELDENVNSMDLEKQQETSRSLTPVTYDTFTEKSTQTTPKIIITNDNTIETTLQEKRVKIQLLKEQCNILKTVRETAGLNKIIAEERLKQVLRLKNIEDRMYSGELGSGAGKGGGGGGSIREAGGAFGKMEAAREEEYFYKKQKEQLANLKSHIHQEIGFHEEQVKRHQEAIERHKAKALELEKTEK